MSLDGITGHILNGSLSSRLSNLSDNGLPHLKAIASAFTWPLSANPGLLMHRMAGPGHVDSETITSAGLIALVYLGERFADSIKTFARLLFKSFSKHTTDRVSEIDMKLECAESLPTFDPLASCFWKSSRCPFNSEGSPSKESPDTESLAVATEGSPTFSESLKKEIELLASFAFVSSSLCTSPRSEIPFERSTIKLACKHEGGNHVIDSAVKIMAEKHGADVLVLDALELVAGEFGALGKAARVVDSIYCETSSDGDREARQNPSHKSNEDSTTNTLATLLAARPTCDPSCTVCGAQSAPARIIYLRDFSMIRTAAKPLLIYLLRAYQHLRSLYDLGGSFGASPKTIFVLGLPDGPSGSSSSDDSDGEVDEDEDEISCSIDASFYQKPFGYSINGLFKEYFAKIGNKYRSYSTTSVEYDSAWGVKVDKISSSHVGICLFAQNSRLESFKASQKRHAAQRIHAINSTLLRVYIGKMGRYAPPGLFLNKPSEEKEKDKEEKDKKEAKEEPTPSLIKFARAEILANIACSIASSRSPPTLAVTSDDIEEANRIHAGVKKEKKGLKDEKEESTDSSTSAKAEEKPIPEDAIVKKVKADSDLSSYEQSLLGCIVDSRLLATTFEDVCVDAAIVDALQNYVSLPLLHPEFFREGILSKEAVGGVLLYGPPGTGKTMLCRALAHKCQARMLIVSPSHITHKYVGESEKTISALFSLASRLSPCIIFIDEADALFTTRDKRSRTWEVDMLTEFMQGMDGLLTAGKNRKERMMVVGATNRPYDLDDAIIRRLPCRMLVDLPDYKQRQNILKKYFQDNKLHEDISIDDLVDRTDGYSGSDLKNLCVAAAMAAASEAAALAGSTLVNGTPAPSSPETPSIIENSSITDTSPNTLTDAPAGTDSPSDTDAPSKTDAPSAVDALPLITPAHVARALREIQPSMSEDGSAELYQWHEAFSSTRYTSGMDDLDAAALPQRSEKNSAKRSTLGDKDLASFMTSISEELRKTNAVATS